MIFIVLLLNIVLAERYCAYNGCNRCKFVKGRNTDKDHVFFEPDSIRCTLHGCKKNLPCLEWAETDDNSKTELPICHVFHDILERKTVFIDKEPFCLIKGDYGFTDSDNYKPYQRIFEGIFESDEFEKLRDVLMEISQENELLDSVLINIPNWLLWIDDFLCENSPECQKCN
jgi:hypothetical protein